MLHPLRLQARQARYATPPRATGQASPLCYTPFGLQARQARYATTPRATGQASPSTVYRDTQICQAAALSSALSWQMHKDNDDDGGGGGGGGGGGDNDDEWHHGCVHECGQ